MVYSLVLAVLLDAAVGDPRWLPHPVRWIGGLISLLERLLYPRNRSSRKEFFTGLLLCLTVLVTFCSCAAGIRALCRMVSFKALVAVEVLLGFYCISARSLGSEARAIYRLLRKKDIPGARAALAMIVGRDTDSLDETEIARATVETVAENITDGIVSPVFYFFLGGSVAALAFKAVSTMDSMIGYTNDRYRRFGTCAARLDDALNFIPARITGLALIPLAALFTGAHGLRSLRIAIRDRYKHTSPNAAHTEAAVAGALGIMLGGQATYSGILSVKPPLGIPGRLVESGDIIRVIRILYVSTVLAVLIGVTALLYAKGGNR